MAGLDFDDKAKFKQNLRHLKKLCLSILCWLPIQGVRQICYE